MGTDDAEQEMSQVRMSMAIDKFVIPGYKNGIGKPTIIARLMNAGFDKETAAEVVDRYEPSPGRSTPDGKPTRVDCPNCGAKSVYVTSGDDFAGEGLSSFLSILSSTTFCSSRGVETAPIVVEGSPKSCDDGTQKLPCRVSFYALLDPWCLHPER